jgi:hypothetical protein
VLLKVIKKFLLVFFIIIDILLSKPNLKLPSYEEGKKIVILLLKNHFPIPEYQLEDKNWEVEEFPPKKRLLRKFYKNSYIYYYHYKVKIPIYNKENDTYKIQDYRIEEIWLRISPLESYGSLSFLREDLLPGDFSIYIQ